MNFAPAWRKFTKDPLAMGGSFFLIIVFIIALFAPFLAPDKSEHANRMLLPLSLSPPGTHWTILSNKMTGAPMGDLIYENDVVIDSIIQTGDSVRVRNAMNLQWTHLNIATANNRIKQGTFLLGADRFGRDVLSRLIVGARVSCSVGLLAVMISLFLGVILGLLAGYFGQRVDQVVMWLINVVWSLPTLLLVIAITLAIGKGFWQVFLAVGLTMWVDLARIIRGQVMSLREMEYIQAAKVLGFSHFRIILKHILPNVWAPVIVLAAANFASAILLEAGLSFLGLGVQAPAPSWGMMIKEHYSYIVFDAAFLALFPGICIMLTVMSVNFVGNGLRNALDVKL